MKRIRLRFLAVISIVFLLNISPAFAEITWPEVKEGWNSYSADDDVDSVVYEYINSKGKNGSDIISTKLTQEQYKEIERILSQELQSEIKIWNETNGASYRLKTPDEETVGVSVTGSAETQLGVGEQMQVDAFDNPEDKAKAEAAFKAEMEAEHEKFKEDSAKVEASLYAPAPDRYNPSSLVPNADNFILAGSTNKNETLRTDVVVDNMDKSIGGGLVSILQLLYQIGLLVAVCVFAFMGVQFIIASPQQKAQLKASLYPYFIGLLLYVAGVPIATIIINIFMQLL